MKQLLQNMKTGKITVAEVPIPSPHRGQVLVKVAASLVSAGTERMVVEFAEKSLVGKARSRPDLVRQVVDKMKREGAVPAVKAAFARLDQSMALGYSSSGTIVSLGEGMDGFKVGQRVACAGGGYASHAEYNVVPRNLLTPIPDSLDFESAAFVTLGAIAMHGLRLGEPQLGARVAVIGMGLVGLLAGQLAVSAGCEVLGVDTNPQRVDLAASLGISSCSRDQALERSRSFTSGRGFDLVLICADTPSNDPVELAAAIARDRAHIVATGAVGLSLPRKIYYEKELSFINSRSYGPGRYDHAYEEEGQDYPLGYVRWTEGRNLESVAGLIADGKLKVQPLISHRFPIGNVEQAYEIITGKKKEPFLGVILSYPGGSIQLKEKIIYAGSVKAPSAVKLGVLGAGLFPNATLLPAIKKVKDVGLVGIVSAAGVHAQTTARKFGFQYAATAEEEILGDPEINTVAILTRHESHARLAVRALQAGKNVFVEKPLAITREQVSEVEHQLQQPGNHVFMAGFNRRFSPLAGELLSFLSDRREPLYMHYRINAGYIPPSHWVHDPVIGGGRIVGEGCHFVDFLTFLAGAVPIRVMAQSLPDEGRYHEDNVSMTFTYPDGSVGVVDYLANGDKSFAKERVEVFCAGSVAVLNDFRTLEMVRNGRRRVIKKPQDKGWQGEWEAFSRAIRDGGEPPIPYDQMMGVTKAMLLVLESMRGGQALSLE